MVICQGSFLKIYVHVVEEITRFCKLKAESVMRKAKAKAKAKAEG